MHYAYNGMKFNSNRPINWKLIWRNFNKLVGDDTLENLGLFKQWTGKHGQAALLRALLAKYVIADDAEWTKFKRKFQNWYSKEHYFFSQYNSWKRQQKWIQDYFKALDVS